MFAGGEIGYQVKKADGSKTIKYKEYGTRADVLATMMPDNRIHLDAHLCVSEPVSAKPERTAAGFLSSLIGPGECTVPSINSRESECGLILHSGQTAIIVGLVEMQTFDHVPEKVEMFVMLRATLATKETPKPTEDKASGTARRSDGSTRR
jgi:Flp pilus assembly secretin CpaC